MQLRLFSLKTDWEYSIDLLPARATHS